MTPRISRKQGACGPCKTCDEDCCCDELNPTVTGTVVDTVSGVQLCWKVDGPCITARATKYGGGAVAQVEVYFGACPPADTDTPAAVLDPAETCVWFSYDDLNASDWGGMFCIVVRGDNGEVLIRCTYKECGSGSGGDSSGGSSGESSGGSSGGSSGDSSGGSSGDSSGGSSDGSSGGSSGDGGGGPPPPPPPPTSGSSSGESEVPPAGCYCRLTGTVEPENPSYICESGSPSFAVALYLTLFNCDCTDPCSGNWHIGTTPGAGDLVYTGMGPLEGFFNLPCPPTYGEVHNVFITFTGTLGAVAGIQCSFIVSVGQWD